MTKKKPDLIYVEPDDYFPEDILRKCFPEVFEDDKNSEKRAETNVVKPENDKTNTMEMTGCSRYTFRKLRMNSERQILS